jgi:hypothetical protein
MPDILASVVILLVLLVVLCVPPVLLIQMIVRRRAAAPLGVRPLYQGGIAAAAGVLAFNLFVSFFAAPHTRDGSIWTTVGSIHLAALILSWLSLWGCVALGVLVRRRRHSNAEAGNGRMA